MHLVNLIYKVKWKGRKTIRFSLQKVKKNQEMTKFCLKRQKIKIKTRQQQIFKVREAKVMMLKAFLLISMIRLK